MIKTENLLCRINKTVELIKKLLGKNCYAILLRGSAAEYYPNFENINPLEIWDLDILVLTWLPPNKSFKDVIKLDKDLDIGNYWFLAFYRLKDNPYSALIYKENMENGKILYISKFGKILHKILK